MNEFLRELIIGIIGGTFSGVVVSRVFVIRGELEEQLESLRQSKYWLGSICAFFDVAEIILKLSSDTSEEIENEIKKDPNYLKEHDILNADDVLDTLKEKIFKNAVNRINDITQNTRYMQHQYLELQRKTVQQMESFNQIKTIKFSTLDEYKDKLNKLVEEYDNYIVRGKKLFWSLILKDKAIMFLLLLFVTICIVAFAI